MVLRDRLTTTFVPQCTETCRTECAQKARKQNEKREDTRHA